VFQDERVAMRSFFHCLATRLDDSDPSRFARLDVLGRFGGQSKVNKGVDSRRRLRAGDGVAEVAVG